MQVPVGEMLLKARKPMVLTSGGLMLCARGGEVAGTEAIKTIAVDRSARLPLCEAARYKWRVDTSARPEAAETIETEPGLSDGEMGLGSDDEVVAQMMGVLGRHVEGKQAHG